jgi:hypothetical protein
VRVRARVYVAGYAYVAEMDIYIHDREAHMMLTLSFACTSAPFASSASAISRELANMSGVFPACGAREHRDEFSVRDHGSASAAMKRQRGLELSRL